MSESTPSAAPAQALVLIAEDEPEIAEILSAYLQRSGLRKKLEALGIDGVPASVWGVGYRFGGDA
ncbi:MAG: hypothetical protein KGZ68_16715 [Dechloromonas sp.]|jgi:DNA-binding response OmpR family regulator|nr:hypothetical protein [Dechloromonas sp.]